MTGDTVNIYDLERRWLVLPSGARLTIPGMRPVGALAVLPPKDDGRDVAVVLTSEGDIVALVGGVEVVTP